MPSWRRFVKDPTEPRFIWRAVPIQLVGLALLIIGNLLSPHVWLWSVLGTSLYAFGIGLIFPTLFRFTLFSNNLPKGTVSASLNMVILMVMSVSVEIGRWLWFNGGSLAVSSVRPSWRALSSFSPWRDCLIACANIRLPSWQRSSDFCAILPSGSILNVMNKLIELRRAKMLALSLLLIAAATFVVTLFLPPNFWVSGVKAIAEAAMVGALADWFAVVALFRRVPIPIISRHTAIIPRNKDRIGENLGQFVQEKFLDTQSLVALIRRHEPALLIGNWFSQPENARRVGQHLLQIMSGFLELTDDARIQRLLKRAVHRAIDKVDLSGTSALMLESMTKKRSSSGAAGYADRTVDRPSPAR